MSSPAEAPVAVLLVEPDISAQLDGLDAVQQAHARVDLTCVATAGGALHALATTHFDCLLLSTSLHLYPPERDDLLALVRRARACGVAVLAFGLGDPCVLAVPVHGALGPQDIVWGRMNDALAQARARAQLERRFTSDITGLGDTVMKAR